MKLGKIVVAFCLAATMLVGCGGKPKDVSQDMYDLGLKALEVTEDYLAADLDIDAAYEKMSDILTRTTVDEAFKSDISIQKSINLINATMELVSAYPEHEKNEIESLKEYKKEFAKELGQ